jgi:hypothetical protein
MRILLLLFLFLTPFGTYAFGSKPFVRITQTVLPKDSYKLPSACSFRKFYPQHIEHLVNIVLPRVESEIDELIEPHILDGKSFAVADTISYADLFHFHWRFPTHPTSFTKEELTDSNNYHLLYHSFEHLDFLLIAWLKSIDSMSQAGTKAKDPELSLWLSERLAQNKPGGSSSPANDSYTVNLQHIKFSDDKLQTLTSAWHTSLGNQSPGIYRLALRLKVLNDKFHESAAITELLENRNLVSFTDHYEILRFSSLPDSWQPATVYFDKIENNPQIAAELGAFMKKTKKKWLSNPEGPTAAYLPLDKNLRMDSIEAIHNIKGWAQKNRDPLNIFKKTVLGPNTTITTFAMTDKYIFAVSHSISDTECL